MTQTDSMESYVILKYGSKSQAIIQWIAWRVNPDRGERSFTDAESRIIALWWKDGQET